MCRNKIATVFAVTLTGILLVFFCSCKKQAEAVNDKTNILASGTWRLTAFTVYSITGTVDVYASYSAYAGAFLAIISIASIQHL